MRDQVTRYLKDRYPGADVSPDAPTVGEKHAYALHFEIWTDAGIRHVWISDEAIAVMKGVVNIADELNQIGLGDALDKLPYAAAIHAVDSGRGLRLSEPPT